MKKHRYREIKHGQDPASRDMLLLDLQKFLKKCFLKYKPETIQNQSIVLYET